MFIYARSKQCDLGPIYTITNKQRIRIYQTLFMFLNIENLSGQYTIHIQFIYNTQLNV